MRPWRGRRMRVSPAPNPSTPSRFPRRVATWPTASATPSATSALRRSAVPNCDRGRHVEHEPGGQRPLADVHAHVRLLQARGRVPVDVADVVARVVRADHRQLGALRRLRREVLAGDEALDPLHHREVERAQDGGRDRARPGPGRPCGPLPVEADLMGGAASRARGRSRRRASSSTSAPPAKADVTCCFSLVLVRRVPMLRYTASSWRVLAVAKNWPPVSRAIPCSVSRSGGTRSVFVAPVSGSVWVSVPFCRAQRHRVDRDLVLLGVLARRRSGPTRGCSRRHRAARSRPASRRAPPRPSGTGTRAELIASFERVAHRGRALDLQRARSSSSRAGGRSWAR